MTRYSSLATALVFCAAAQMGMATQSFSFNGTFSSDTDIQFFTFTLAADTPSVTLLSWSYGGGTNFAGSSISAGGFEISLGLFQSDGTMMNPATIGSGVCPAIQTVDPVTSVCGDVYYPTSHSFGGGSWLAGTYYAAITINGNDASDNLNFADPSQTFFQYEVEGLSAGDNFTCMIGWYQGSPPVVPTTDPFCGQASPDTVAAKERNGTWALDILNVDSAVEGLQATAPEPGTIALCVGGLACLAARRRRK